MEEYTTFPADIIHVNEALQKARKEITQLIRDGIFPIKYTVNYPKFNRKQTESLCKELEDRGFDVDFYRDNDFYINICNSVEFTIDKPE